MPKNKNTKTNQELIQEINKMFGVQVPIEIKNYEAYLNYLKLENNPIHQIKFRILDKEVPITFPIPVIKARCKKAIDHGLMTEEEAEKINKTKMTQQKLKMKALSYQRASYGTIVNQKGEKVEATSIFSPVETQMIELFGRMFTDKEVHEICLTQWKLKVNITAVGDFRRRHISEINKRIEEHKRTFSDIRLGHKRSRLEELVWLYNKRKRIYEISGKGEDHRLLLSTLDQIKKEAEGDVLRIDGNINVGLDVTINDHIQKDLNRTIPIKEIILARVAAKTKSSPVKLMKYINDSIYRKVLDSAEEAEVVYMPQYPSLQNYDFDKIRRVQEQEAQNKVIETRLEETPEPDKLSEADELKKLLLKKLSGKQGDLNQEKNNLSKNF